MPSARALPLLALLGLLTAPLLASAPAAALTQFTISNISAHLPDTDGFLEGDSDPFIEVRVDGQLAGTTSIIGGNNNPTWPGTVFTIQLNPGTTPFTIIELKAFDDDAGVPEYQGNIQIGYNWVAGNVASVTFALNTIHVGAYTISATVQATEVPVPVAASTWSSIKALYRR